MGAARTAPEPLLIIACRFYGVIYFSQGYNLAASRLSNHWQLAHTQAANNFAKPINKFASKMNAPLVFARRAQLAARAHNYTFETSKCRVAMHQCRPSGCNFNGHCGHSIISQWMFSSQCVVKFIATSVI
jgi:hypothetical protein